MKKVLIRLTLVLVVGAAVWGGYRVLKALPERQEQIPVTRVRRGDVVVRSYSRGELRAVRSVTLTAPNLFGTVQVTKLAALGSFAREKDLIVEFDDAEVLSRLEDKQLELDQTDEQIKKAQADLAIRNNQDEVELLRARYAVRRAELEVKRNELVSAIDAKKNILSLEEAQRRLKQLESDIKSRREQAQAELAVLRERRNKTLVEMNRERARLSQVKLLAPISGLVAIKQNRTGFGMFGMQVPDIREGDQVQPGMPIAEILDLSELEVVARVPELDRANLREGQEVLLSLDAIPEKKFNGKIKAMSGTATANMFSSDPQKKFEVIFSIDMRQLLSALGAKPDQVARIMATAEENRKKPIASTLASMSPAGFDPSQGPAFLPAGGFSGEGPGGGPMMGGQAGPVAQGGADGAAGAGRQGGGMRGRGSGGAFGNMSPEDAQKMRDAMQKVLAGRNMRDLSPEERRKVMEEAAKKAGVTLPEGGQRMRFGFAGPGGQGGPDALGGRPFGLRSPYTESELANAKLPPPPEEDSQLDVLLRPGLLADVEIIVEKIPEALHIPNQAVFEKDGRPVVYVKEGSRFEARPIKIAKRSESTTIIQEGLEEGEVIALSNPDEKPNSKKKKSESKGNGGGSPLGGMPAGGGAGR
jgi:Multidrug resistance efflux pump